MKILNSIAFTIGLSLCAGIAFSQNNTNLGGDAGNAGTDNTAIGFWAGNLVTGTYNTFVGSFAGPYLTTGTANIFVGLSSGGNATTGSNNTIVGRSSGFKLTSGNHNTFLGLNAGYNVVTNSGNVALGSGAGYYSAGGSNVFIGYNSGPTSTSADIASSNKLYIDNSTNNTPLIYGDFFSNKVAINMLNTSTLNHTLSVGGAVNSTEGFFVNGVAVSGDLTYWMRDIPANRISTTLDVYTGTIYTTGIFVNGQPVGGDLSFWTKHGMTNNFYNATDNVGIGVVMNPFKNSKNYRLAVKGKIGAWEIEIENNSLIWSDFVFKKDYKLLPLKEVEKFIDENGHLPEIPSEQEVKENGLRLAEMDAKLLMKIEELTLYVIELEKKIEALEKKSKK